MRVIIVDDEPLARERIRSLLQAEKDVEVLAEAANGEEGAAAVRAFAPDLVFLDIQMPGMGGFEMLRSLGRDPLPLVIFVTAYDQHALRAFEVHAQDYLLKPFKQARFRETLQRARAVLQSRESADVSSRLAALLAAPAPALAPAPERLTRIPIRNGDRTTFVKTSQIDYAESAGNYVVLHVGKENHVVRETLTALEEKLDPRKFVRVNRSTLVNLDQIKEIQPLFKGEHVVLLQNGKQLPLTRGVRELEDLLRFS
jgi:two-component system LytT family response regulator